MKTVLLTTLLCSALLVSACSPEKEVDEMEENMMEEEMMDKEDMEERVQKQEIPAANTPPPVAECGTKNAHCESTDDCCGSMGLECQQVRTSDGGFGKRCLPVEVMVCRSDCIDGVWGEKRSCKKMVAPSDMVSCESFVGDPCKESVNNHRNDRECTDT